MTQLPTPPAKDPRVSGTPGLGFWIVVAAYAALRASGIRVPMHLLVPAVLILMVLLAVRSERTKAAWGARYRALWPSMWRGVWILLGLGCLTLAAFVPAVVLLFMGDSGSSLEAVAGVSLAVVAVCVVLASVCFWVAVRGHRAAFALAGWGDEWVSAGARAAARLVAWWRRRRAALLLGQPWDDLLRAAGWVAFAFLACIPMLQPTETRRSVFLWSVALCVTMAAFYAGAGRLYLRRRERRLVRRVFQPFVLGSLLSLALALFGMAISTFYETY